MTKTQSFIADLPKDKKKAISQCFISPELFYEAVYLIVQNGHILQQSQPDMWEMKLKNIEYYQQQIEAKLDGMGFNGKDLVADIASDYFEDYVHYREAKLSITSEQFLGIIRSLQ
ncbi:MAG: hypothetical protein M0P12_02680 [Paludibacteraceae bacterium]|nr:hypothetical protein [Paludibacteraceae bacterium]HOU68452.1 hypothetical protein [Paludibacteraceae bacterium]HQF50293.1 hypothetical protein [Paludibacteraceae bacterium]HQJ89496.1 hypothetical protein [Paludibacteraceae bacterium]